MLWVFAVTLATAALCPRSPEDPACYMSPPDNDGPDTSVYAANSNCTVPLYEAEEWQFLHAEVEWCPGCVCDYFILEDTGIESTEEFCNFPQNLDLVEINPISDQTTLRFISDSDVQYPGFLICPTYAEPTRRMPTAEPTQGPTSGPSTEPTAKPTAEPTQGPTSEPSTEPTAKPTVEPTQGPTSEPSTEPTAKPTAKPTTDPTTDPTSGVQKTLTKKTSSGDPSAHEENDDHYHHNDHDHDGGGWVWAVIFGSVIFFAILVCVAVDSSARGTAYSYKEVGGSSISGPKAPSKNKGRLAF